MIRVLIADDQALVRTGFRMILAGPGDIQVVAEAGDGREAVNGSVMFRPDVVLMDVRMPGLDGIEATRRILAHNFGRRPPRILMLTTFDLDEYLVGALRAGASGFLLKDTLAADLLSAIRIVFRGDAVVAPALTRRLFERYLATAEGPPRVDAAASLTPREQEVLEQVARGLSNAEIADRLRMSEGTVKTHVGRILSKLELRDRVGAVIFAYETRLLRPGCGGLEARVGRATASLGDRDGAR